MKVALSAGWLQAARAVCDAPPSRPREPLRVSGALSTIASAIGSIEASLAQRAVEAGLLLHRDRSGWLIAAAIGDDLDAALARIARWLAAEGLGGTWRDELLRVTGAAGEPVGSIERAAVRALGIATTAVHLIGRAADGAVWVQQRAFDKAVDPGCWDTLMGGMVSADESIDATLARETREEAGLRIADLHALRRCGELTVRRPVADGYQIERIVLFEATLPAGLVPINQDGEVAAFECLSAEALAQRLQAGAFTPEAGLMLGEWLGGGGGRFG